ncbi:hypothetical protein [Daejeonella rubra]|nr:hypothetical protein [Daejeonella rubra]
MKFIFIIQLRKLPVQGMAMFPFIFLKTKDLKLDKRIINHELIHIRQQLELLIIPFYLLYFLNYLANWIYYRDHYLAYRNIVFEREAFENDLKPGYLKKRRFASWVNYFRQV